MRREQLFRMDRAEAMALLRTARVVHLATTSPTGVPILRTVHGIVLDDAVYFHGSPVGEKTEGLGREVVLSAEEIVASIPSYFVDPQRACPATTLYRSVQVHGVLEEVTSREEKARMLQALMERFQPEGGHVPVTADHPLYRGPVNGLLIARVSLERLDGKAKLAQNRTAAERKVLLERLWRRGDPGDVRAITLIQRAAAGTPVPDFLRSPVEDVRLIAAVDPARVEEGVRLLEGTYWNEGLAPERIRAALLNATAWVGAEEAATGRLVAQARALSDGAKWAWIYDVVTAPSHRRRGLASALVKLLLDHPAVRDARQVCLATRDAMEVYRKLGFVERSALPPRSYVSVEMALRRPG